MMSRVEGDKLHDTCSLPVLNLQWNSHSGLIIKPSLCLERTSDSIQPAERGQQNVTATWIVTEVASWCKGLKGQQSSVHSYCFPHFFSVEELIWSTMFCFSSPWWPYGSVREKPMALRQGRQDGIQDFTLTSSSVLIYIGNCCLCCAQQQWMLLLK